MSFCTISLPRQLLFLLPVIGLTAPLPLAAQQVDQTSGDATAFVMDSNTLRHLWLLRQSGLRALVARIEAEGGRYEVAEDGSIRIIPSEAKQEELARLAGGTAVQATPALSGRDGGDAPSAENASGATEDLPATADEPEGGSLSSPGSEQSSPVTEGATMKEEAVVEEETKVEPASEGEPSFVMDSTTMQRLWALRQGGMHALLERLAATGGSYQVLPNGVIRIIPSDADLERLSAVVRSAVEETNAPAQTESAADRQATAEEAVEEVTVETEPATTRPGVATEDQPAAETVPSASAPTASVAAVTESVSEPANRVTSWMDALRIAGEWVKANGSGESMVSGIQQVGGLYVVTLLDARAPHRMRSQLVIRATDGRLVAFDERRISIW